MTKDRSLQVTSIMSSFINIDDSELFIGLGETKKGSHRLYGFTDRKNPVAQYLKGRDARQIIIKGLKAEIVSKPRKAANVVKRKHLKGVSDASQQILMYYNYQTDKFNCPSGLASLMSAINVLEARNKKIEYFILIRTEHYVEYKMVDRAD